MHDFEISLKLAVNDWKKELNRLDGKYFTHAKVHDIIDGIQWSALRLFNEGWINVDEKTPEPLDTVLCCDEFGYMQVAGYADYWYNKINGEKLTNGKITHWRYLPNEPEKLNAGSNAV